MHLGIAVPSESLYVGTEEVVKCILDSATLASNMTSWFPTAHHHYQMQRFSYVPLWTRDPVSDLSFCKEATKYFLKQLSEKDPKDLQVRKDQ